MGDLMRLSDASVVVWTMGGGAWSQPRRGGRILTGGLEAHGEGVVQCDLEMAASFRNWG